jgi:hypothetical protein
MSIPTDVFNEIVLSFAPLNVARFYRNDAPEAYIQATERKNDRYSRLLVAVANDDLELFTATFRAHDGHTTIGWVIPHLVLNIMGDQSTVVQPIRILNYLFEKYDYLIGDALRINIGFFTNNIDNYELIDRAFDLMDTCHGIDLDTPYDDYLGNIEVHLEKYYPFTPKMLEEDFYIVLYYLIRDLLARKYPKVGFVELFVGHRRSFQTCLLEILRRMQCHDRWYFFEEIKSLDADRLTSPTPFADLHLRRMHSLDAAHRWNEAINNPENYPELVRMMIYLGPITLPYLYEYVDIIGDSIVRPDLLVKAVVDAINDPKTSEGYAERYAYFLIRKVLDIPFGPSPFNDYMELQEDEIDGDTEGSDNDMGDEDNDEDTEEIESRKPVRSPFNDNTKRQVALAILSIYPNQYEQEPGCSIETENEFSRFHDQIVKLAQ